MAHEISEVDAFGETRLNGKKAWHGLGIEIEPGLTATDGFKKIGLGWNTELLPVQCMTSDNRIVFDKDFRMHVRMDTCESLGVVGKDYKVISNQFLAEFVDSLCGAGVQVKLETAGSLRRGRRVFCSIKLPTTIEIVNDDILDMYIIASNAHDGSGGCNLYGSSIRPVCANTLGWSERELFRGISFAHTGDVKMKIEMARQALGILVKQSEVFGEEIKHMAKVKFSRDQVAGYFEACYKAMFGAIPDEELADADEDKAKQRDRKLSHREKTLSSWNILLESEKQNIKGIEGTAWSALNAITEWSDHERGRFGPVQESDGRVHSNLFGVSYLDKRKALKVTRAVIRDNFSGSNVAALMA